MPDQQPADMNSTVRFLCIFVAVTFVVITGAAVVPYDNVEVILAEVESPTPPPPRPEQRQLVQVGQSVMNSLQNAGRFAVGIFGAFFSSSIAMAVGSAFLGLLWMFKVSLFI